MSLEKSSILPPSSINKSSSAINTPIMGAQQKSFNQIIDNKKIIFKSQIMEQLLNMVERVATSGANILILGESGTGKELIAKNVHQNSQRRNRPFVAVNCGALTETLLESELFGHEKGAFTGAYARKIGLAEAASGGTLFLDEIGELSPGIQAKLLRFIQEGEVYRVGGKEPIQIDIRLISATNRDLEEEVKNGNFREDLFYRINTIITQVPALRQRKEDIPLLVESFLARKSNGYVRFDRQMSEEAMAVLTRYDWPGNIRELENTCERLQILADGSLIMPGDLPDNIREPDQRITANDYDSSITLHELERRYILKALNHFDGNKTQAANALGITIKTLYNKLHEYGEFERFAVHTATTPAKAPLKTSVSK